MSVEAHKQLGNTETEPDFPVLVALYTARTQNLCNYFRKHCILFWLMIPSNLIGNSEWSLRGTFRLS
jgi:hypothetical protein